MLGGNAASISHVHLSVFPAELIHGKTKYHRCAVPASIYSDLSKFQPEARLRGRWTPLHDAQFAPLMADYD